MARKWLRTRPILSWARPVYDRVHYYTCFFDGVEHNTRYKLDVYHTSTYGVVLCVNLECRSEMHCARLAENTVAKIWPGKVVRWCQNGD